MQSPQWHPPPPLLHPPHLPTAPPMRPLLLLLGTVQLFLSIRCWQPTSLVLSQLSPLALTVSLNQAPPHPATAWPPPSIHPPYTPHCPPLSHRPLSPQSLARCPLLCHLSSLVPVRRTFIQQTRPPAHLAHCRLAVPVALTSTAVNWLESERQGGSQRRSLCQPVRLVARPAVQRTHRCRADSRPSVLCWQWPSRRSTCPTRQPSLVR